MHVAPGDAPPGPRFVVLGAAVVRDGRTGLEWTRHDDGVGLDWYKAGAYCQALMIDDAGRWRLPGIEKLRGLDGGTTRISCGDARRVNWRRGEQAPSLGRKYHACVLDCWFNASRSSWDRTCDPLIRSNCQGVSASDQHLSS